MSGIQLLLIYEYLIPLSVEVYLPNKSCNALEVPSEVEGLFLGGSLLNRDEKKSVGNEVGCDHHLKLNGAHHSLSPPSKK